MLFTSILNYLTLLPYHWDSSLKQVLLLFLTAFLRWMKFLPYIFAYHFKLFSRTPDINKFLLCDWSRRYISCKFLILCTKLLTLLLFFIFFIYFIYTTFFLALGCYLNYSFLRFLFKKGSFSLLPEFDFLLCLKLMLRFLCSVVLFIWICVLYLWNIF